MRDPIPSESLLKDIPPFAGFPREARRFFVGLGTHNDRSWFEAHRAEYDTHVLGPMRAFVVAAGKRLRPRVPKLIADPRVGGSVMRIARDTRFSPDKSPYKTWIAARLWDGAGPGKDFGPGFYIHVDAETAYAGGGIYMFDDDQLDRFRVVVSDKRLARTLRTILGRLSGLEIGGSVLKRVPRGFAPGHPAGDLLRHKGLYAGCDLDHRRVSRAALLDDAVEVYERLLPLHRWLMEHVIRGPVAG
jgi:uncharacterized protein (TIGR02453 family)